MAKRLGVFILLVTFFVKAHAVKMPSRKNYWHGATIAYNFDGLDIDNVIGNTKVEINPFTGNKPLIKGNWAIIGNIGNFVSAQSKEDASKDIKKLAQQIQGLNVGLGSVWEYQSGALVQPAADLSNVKPLFRIEFITAYRLNGFQNVGVDTQTIVISQFRNSLALEYETAMWGENKDAGRLSVTLEGAISVFDGQQFEKVYNHYRDALASAELTAILPLAKNFGVMGNMTVAQKTRPIYQMGIIIKPN